MKNKSRVGLGAVLALALLGCTTPPALQGPYLGFNPTIAGTLVGYTGTAGKITLNNLSFSADVGNIAANGAFSVTLPSSGFSLGALPGITCVSGTGSITVTPSDAKFQDFFVARLPNSGSLTQGDASKNTLGDVFFSRYRMFVDKDVVINGSCEFKINNSGAKRVYTYNNLSLKAGWNEISQKNTVNSSNDADLEYSLGIPSTQPWRNGSSGF